MFLLTYFFIRGQQLKYRGHVVHFLRDLSLLPKDLDIVILRPAGTQDDPENSQLHERRVVETWLEIRITLVIETLFLTGRT
jgi:hypothetical protein